MRRTTEVVLRGGFHDSPEIRIWLPRNMEFLRATYHDQPVEVVREWVDRLISDGQRKKLEKHFCGIKGCDCGSWTRAGIRI
jgi:hypothetical protein